MVEISPLFELMLNELWTRIVSKSSEDDLQDTHDNKIYKTELCKDDFEGGLNRLLEEGLEPGKSNHPNPTKISCHADAMITDAKEKEDGYTDEFEHHISIGKDQFKELISKEICKTIDIDNEKLLREQYRLFLRNGSKRVNASALKSTIQDKLKMPGQEFSDETVLGPDGKVITYIDNHGQTKEMTHIHQTVQNMMDIMDNNGTEHFTFENFKFFMRNKD